MQKLSVKLAILFCLLPAAAKAMLLIASNTTVTATVTDTSGHALSKGTWIAELVVPGANPSTVTARGVPVVSPRLGVLDDKGVMTVALPNTGSMDQPGVKWKITVCPNASVAAHNRTGCASYITATTEAKLDLTSKLSAVAMPEVPAKASSDKRSSVANTVAAGGPGGNICNLQYNADGTNFGGDTGTCTDGVGNITVTSLIGKFVSSLGMGKQWRSTSSATDGCQSLFNAGYLSCYIEPGYVNDAGIMPTAANPVTHIIDRSYPGDSDIATDSVLFGSAGTPAYTRRYLYTADNNTPGLHPNAYDTRPTGSMEYLNFTTRGRSDGGGNTTQWSVGTAHYSNLITWGAGIHESDTKWHFAYGIGDNTLSSGFLRYRGGSPTGSDEGNTGSRIQVLQDGTDVVGTIVAGTPGASTVKIVSTPAQDAQFIGVQHMLVDKNAVTYTGNIVSQSLDAYQMNAVVTDATFVPSTWIGRSLLFTGVPPPININNPPTSTFIVTTTNGDPSTLAIGDHVCFAPAGSSGGEELPIQTLSITGSGIGSTVTIGVPTRRGAFTRLTIAKNVNGATPAQNIGCGALDAVSQRLQTPSGVTNMMNPSMVVGYTDSHTMLVGYWLTGTAQGLPLLNTNWTCPITISRTGTTFTGSITNSCTNGLQGGTIAMQNNPNLKIDGTTNFNGVPPTSPTVTTASGVSPAVFTWTTTGSPVTIGPETGTITATNTSQAFNIWPMANIFNVCDNAVTAPVTWQNPKQPPCLDGSVDLEANLVAWAPNDPFEVPHFNAIRSAGGRWVLNGWTPSTVNAGLSINVGGEAYGNGSPILDLISSDNVYWGSGGRKMTPPTGLSLRGMNSGIVSGNAPSLFGASAYFVSCANITTYTSTDCNKTAPYYALGMQSAAGVSAVAFNPRTGTTTLTNPMNGANTRFDSPVGLPTCCNANFWTSAALKNFTGALFYDSTTNRVSTWDNTLTLHQIPWKDEVCTTNCAPTGTAGGDLGGTYPNPSVVKVNGASIPLSSTYVGTDGSGHIVAAPSSIAGVSYSGNLSASRSYGSNYTNTSGHRIKVLWTGLDVGGSHAVRIYCSVNGNLISSVSVGGTTAGDQFTVECDVANGDTYQVNTDSSGGRTAASTAQVLEETF